MSHVILLGDSIFDNARYVPGEPDVVRQVRAALPSGWKASLLAVDGAIARNVAGQLTNLPADATHLIVSVGGNDALQVSRLLGEQCGSVGEALLKLNAARDAFAEVYAAMLKAVLGRGLPTALCTIYDTPPGAPDQPLIRAGLSFFNDVITRAAFSRRLPLIDLRLICDRDEDYAKPIEPSAVGGAKIAAAVSDLVQRDWPRNASLVSAGA